MDKLEYRKIKNCSSENKKKGHLEQILASHASNKGLISQYNMKTNNPILKIAEI